MDADKLVDLLEAIGARDLRGTRDLASAAAGEDQQLAISLEAVLLNEDDPSVHARQVGDLLREAGYDRNLVNECYRFSFYSSSNATQVASSDFFSLFMSRRGQAIVDKWPHYFPIYDQHLSKYRGEPIKALEIGTYHGGGMDLLREFLGPEARLVGLDNDPEAVRYAGKRHEVVLGDQSDGDLLTAISREYGPFDLVIDDGSHVVDHQLASLRTLIPLMNSESTYIVEDTHTSYWPEYGGSMHSPHSFLGQLRVIIDDLHAYHWSRSTPPTPWADIIRAVHIYDSVVIIDRGRHDPPFSELSGGSSFIRSGRPSEAALMEVVRSREFAASELDELTSRTRELERLVAQYDRELNSLEARSLRADSERDHALAQLAQVQSSRTWSLLVRLKRARELVNRLAP